MLIEKHIQTLPKLEFNLVNKKLKKFKIGIKYSEEYPIYNTNKAKQIALKRKQVADFLDAYEFKRKATQKVSNVRREATLISRRKKYGSTTQSYSNEL